MKDLINIQNNDNKCFYGVILDISIVKVKIYLE